MIRIVGVRNEDVTHVVQVAVVSLVATNYRGLHQITEDVNAAIFVQSHCTVVRLQIIYQVKSQIYM